MRLFVIISSVGKNGKPEGAMRGGAIGGQYWSARLE
jgi:hypothetical protein